MITDSPQHDPLSTGRPFEFSGMGSLQIQFNSSWIAGMESGAPDMPPSLTFKETADGAARLLISVLPLDGSSSTPQDLLQLLEKAFEALRDQVVETKVRPYVIATHDGMGCFFTVTDRAPKASEFVYMTSGYVPAGKLLLSFTILSNPDEGMLVARALAAVRSAKPLETTDAPTTLDQALKTFLGFELNSEASLFVQNHPELLSDAAILRLQELFHMVPPEAVHVFTGALYAIYQARTLGMSSVFAPGEMRVAPVEALRLIDVLSSTALDDATADQIRILESAIQQAGSDAASRSWANLHLRLGWLLSLGREDTPESGEKRIAHLQSALDACASDADVFLRAAISTQLCTGYLSRKTGDPASNVEMAIQFANRALQALDGSGFIEDWIVAKNRLGMAYARRIRDYKDRNIETAIECFNRALSFCQDQNSPSWGVLHHNLGNVLLERRLGDRYDNARKAIEHLDSALIVRVKDRMPEAWAATQLNMGNAQLRLATIDIEAREKAIRCYEQARSVFSQKDDPVNWAGIQHNLGVAYRDREIGKPEANAAMAKSCFKDALTVRTLQNLPRDYRSSQIALGGMCLAAHQWQEAGAALQGAIAADENLLTMTVTNASIHAALSETSTAYSDASYCLLRLGHVEEAFLTLEKGKARFLSQALSPSRDEEVDSNIQRLEVTITGLDLPVDESRRKLVQQTRDELPHLVDQLGQLRRSQTAGTSKFQLSDLLPAIPAGGALVAPVITEAGCAVFVVKGGDVGISADDVVWIDGFTRDRLRRILVGTQRAGQADGWLGAYFQRQQESRNWHNVIIEAGASLWTELFAPVHARLQEIGLLDKAPLVLLLPSGLSILPIHASWRVVEAKKRYLAEDYTVAHCPSALVLAHSKRELQRRQLSGVNPSNSMLVVADPTLDLPFAALEGKAVVTAGDPGMTELLLGKSASWKAVTNAVGKQAYIHFACHGSFDLKYPMQSFLALADPGKDAEYDHATGNLWLLELFGAMETNARLVTLSGCETGITDVMDSPNEYMGLSTGWLNTGAIGVISSLWLVDDLCTMLLMKRFYELHLGAATLAPDAALQAAQLWLKDLTNQEVAEQLAALERQPDLTQEQLALISIRRQEFGSEPPAAQPFSDPYWWAGFTYSGA